MIFERERGGGWREEGEPLRSLCEAFKKREEGEISKKFEQAKGERGREKVKQAVGLIDLLGMRMNGEIEIMIGANLGAYLTAMIFKHRREFIKFSTNLYYFLIFVYVVLSRVVNNGMQSLDGQRTVK